MKRFMLFLIVAIFCSTTAFSKPETVKSKKTTSVTRKRKTTRRVREDVPEIAPRSLDQWTFFQIGFMPNWPNFTKTSNVFGLKIGAPMCSGYGRVYGVEPSLLYSGTRYIGGVQATFWGTCIAREVYGVQASSFGPSITGTIYGIQAVGSLAMADEVIGAQIAPVTLCSTELTGIQFGGVNLSRKSLTGFQGGAVNIAEEVKGVQLGVFNYSDKNGIQFGGINIIRNGWLPFTIIFNIKF